MEDTEKILEKLITNVQKKLNQKEEFGSPEFWHLCFNFFFTEKVEYNYINDFFKTTHIKNPIVYSFYQKIQTTSTKTQELLDFLIQNKESLVKIQPLPFFKSISHKAYLLQTCIENYQNIKHIYLNFNDDVAVPPNFIVFLGNNAYGKTTILEGISKGFSEYLNPYINEQYFIDKSRYYIPKNYRSITSFSFSNTIHQSYELANRYDDYDIFLAYGTNRASIQSPESMAVLEQKQPSTAHLFNNEIPLQNIEHWLKIQSELGAEARIQAVFTILTRLVPELKNIVWGLDLKAGKVLYYEDQNGQKYRLKELSTGQKTIVGLIGDILIRLYGSQNGVINPSDLLGIVLIDELEIHLHPRWQRLFPKMLAEIFPRVQFVVTTHSPMIVLGMPEDTLYFKVFKDTENYIQAERVDIKAHLLNPQLLLSSDLFGLEPEELKSPALRPEDEHLARTESDMQTLQERDEIRKKLIALSQKHSPNPPNAPKDDKH